MKGQFPKHNPTDAELSIDTSRTSCELTSVAMPRGELRGTFHSCEDAFTCHSVSSSSLVSFAVCSTESVLILADEGHAEFLQHVEALRRAGLTETDVDMHAVVEIHPRHVDFRPDRLLRESQGVVARLVE